MNESDAKVTDEHAFKLVTDSISTILSKLPKWALTKQSAGPRQAWLALLTIPRLALLGYFSFVGVGGYIFDLQIMQESAQKNEYTHR